MVNRYVSAHVPLRVEHPTLPLVVRSIVAPLCVKSAAFPPVDPATERRRTMFVPGLRSLRRARRPFRNRGSI
jgi:hypothetical protein